MSLIVRVSPFLIFGKNFPQLHLIIIKNCLQNNFTNIFRNFSYFLLIPFIQRLPFVCLIFKEKRDFVLKFFIFILSAVISLILLCKNTYPSKHTESFEIVIQPHEIVKFLWKSAVILQLQICLTQSAAMIFQSACSLSLSKMKRG